MRDNIIIRKVKENDFLNIDLQDNQYIEKEILEKWDCTELIKQPCWSMEHNNHIIFIGGISKIHEKRYILWSFVSKHAGKKMLLITRKTKQIMNQYCDVRLETNVEENFVNGHRWAKLLGFKYECIMECFSENGSNMAMYSIINRIK